MGSNVFMRNPLWTTGLPAGRTASKSGLVLIGGLAATLAGCSADVARFDFGPNTLNDRSATASISPPSEPMAASRSNLLGSDSPVSASAPRAEGQHTEGGAYIPPASNRTSGVKMAALPSVSQPSAPAPSAALEQPRTLSDAPRAGSEARAPVLPRRPLPRLLQAMRRANRSKSKRAIRCLACPSAIKFRFPN